MGTIRVDRCADGGELLDRAGELLLAREALYARLIGIAGRLREKPEEEADLLVVVQDGKVVTAAVGTHPWPLQVTHGPAPALHALAWRMAEERSCLSGVIGPVTAAEGFAAAWSSRTGVATTPGMRTRSYVCTRRCPRPAAAGRLRRARGHDHRLLVEWVRAFHDEAVPHDPLGDVDAFVTRWLEAPAEAGGFWLWESARRPVAMAGTAGVTPNGIRVLAVYTPPPMRRRGYASALVAGITRQELDRGRRMVFLSADLANATSNTIYPALGYEPVGDEQTIRFHAAGG